MSSRLTAEDNFKFYTKTRTLSNFVFYQKPAKNANIGRLGGFQTHLSLTEMYEGKFCDIVYLDMYHKGFEDSWSLSHRYHFAHLLQN